MAEEKKNLSILGSGSASGGCYEDVKISGSGKIQGDLICNSVTINGSGLIGGDVKAADVVISGSAVIEKRFIAESITVNGSCKAKGDVSGERIQISGRAKVLGAIHSERCTVSGILSVDGDLEAEEFVAEGPVKIGGLCSAERIDMTLSGMASHIKEIGCGILTVRRRFVPALLEPLLTAFGRKKLIADTIEGDHIALEDTEAKVVRGNHVSIGAGCSIGRVYYKSEYKKDDKATVRSAVKE
ncbi:polymer-forming cytoskeletal protein [Sporolactobacillus shoreicorticis]|uniref:Polymer-forming cytoskeletal protein n=1 Tax=Sporolactobacillus shoreicorticis TaxID=1923877 RepID=A0ABW5S663_9BACL|nr:polymer-forming cytoskeletal protein [Sporolactobacillus shoreicorticis]MCO7127154.1 polymer-forming cytoskeletal protein [Sporolactobacillus shoreicorticis]